MFGLGLPLGGAVLLGAILAPTDPVLASGVQLEDIRDRNRLRFSLTGEAGRERRHCSFPLVMLGLGLCGLHDLGAWGGSGGRLMSSGQFSRASASARSAESLSGKGSSTFDVNIMKASEGMRCSHSGCRSLLRRGFAAPWIRISRRLCRGTCFAVGRTETHRKRAATGKSLPWRPL